MSGVRLAVLYGIYPQQLGFCGPQDKSDKKTLLDFLLKKRTNQGKVREILKRFPAAYAYYRLIAKVNKIRDPFDERVVQAYWTGNELLDKVSSKALKEMVERDFSRPGLLKKKETQELAERIPQGAPPHHSFHVYFVGSITGRVKLNDKLRDLCRISWGKIKENSKFQKTNIKTINRISADN